MATIRPIEGGSVHRIQSGQVIVDLCSVVKELVENSIDAGATYIEVRFKNHGLDSIDVQDNGSGVAKEDYGTIALKHHTSKLRNYEDLEKLDTFGFRGEALSSLCALSDVHILTATQNEAPKGSKLVFESSGKLKSTHVVAAQRGTTVVIETIFKNLPVRRQELVKNIKREYGKVLGLLQAYACISTGIKLSVTNTTGKKKSVAFSTKPNETTRENIANVFGAKSLAALAPLDLSFELQPTGRSNSIEDQNVQIVGHISKPTFGEGRQTPDRQMFFVNGRPCALPQLAKVMNEVYRSYNIAQSPFIFADVKLNTNAYDVNVSPDKRTIMLHDQGSLLESVKGALNDLFERQTQTVPKSQHGVLKATDHGTPYIVQAKSTASSLSTEQQSLNLQFIDADDNESNGISTDDNDEGSLEVFAKGHNVHSESDPKAMFSQTLEGKIREREFENTKACPSEEKSNGGDSTASGLAIARQITREEECGASRVIQSSITEQHGFEQGIEEFNQSIRRYKQPIEPTVSPSPSLSPEPDVHSLSSTMGKQSPGTVMNAFDRMRPIRTLRETATITIGEKITTSVIGNRALRSTCISNPRVKSKIWPPNRTPSRCRSSVRIFAAPGTQEDGSSVVDEEEFATKSIDSSIERAASTARSSQESTPEQELEEKSVGIGAEMRREKVRGIKGMRDGNGIGVSFGRATSSEGDSDNEWIDDETKKAKEDAKVAKMIEEAENRAILPTEVSIKRAHNLVKGGHKNSTRNLVQSVDISIDQIMLQAKKLDQNISQLDDLFTDEPASQDVDEVITAEERLSLTVSKSDFSRMRIVGQFNMGFIIAVRPRSANHNHDELFIIDQHASDEKYNFERLQETTEIHHQKLVKPQPLELTAIEEELITDNGPALLRNGFVVEVDNSGDSTVGRRCKLISLPISKEVTFSSRDLEELLVLLEESKHPRPSKVRRMFAMRACRSSVMIGKTLSRRNMENLVSNMGKVDKPWNCPHGRPTMRHLFGLSSWNGWKEEMGVVGLEDRETTAEIDWSAWLEESEE